MYTNRMLLHRYKNFLEKSYPRSSKVFMDFLEVENTYMHELLKNKETKNPAILLQSSLAIMNMQLFFKMPQTEPYIDEMLTMFELNLNRSCKQLPNEPYSGCTSLINLSKYLCHCLRTAKPKPFNQNTSKTQSTAFNQDMPLTGRVSLSDDTLKTQTSPIRGNKPLTRTITLHEDTLLPQTQPSFSLSKKRERLTDIPLL